MTAPEFRIVTFESDEETTCAFDGVGVDALQDRVLFGAFGGRMRIRDHVAPARVEKAVVAARCSLGEINTFNEYCGESAHRCITEDASACGAATNDDDICGELLC